MTVRKTTIQRNNETSVQNFRFYIQIGIALICLWIGWEFHLFINSLESTSVTAATRPPGVEAFLPISALISFLYFIQTGIVHPVHPAGFFIFVGIITMSIVAGKSFCSWFCPVGLVSETIGAFGKRILPKNWHMPTWIDIPLRSLKYLLLLFFLNAIIAMSAVEMNIFLNSDYNIIADVKMYDFFRYLSHTAIIILTILFIASVLFQNFWCRYLCPYGALLGIIGLLSPIKIKRESSNCIDCSLCDKACPSRIKVSKKKMVISDECTSCSSCIDACPVQNTLYFSSVTTKKPIKKRRLLVTAGIIYFLIISGGFALGKWHNSITVEKYKALYQTKDSVNH